MVAFVEMPECVTFPEEDKVILFATWKVLFFCLLKREKVCVKKLFVLPLVKFKIIRVSIMASDSHLPDYGTNSSMIEV